MKSPVSVRERVRAAPRHSGGTFEGHLEGTASLLRLWGCRPALEQAGRHHAVYGSPEGRDPILSRQTGELVAEIGEEAERLVRLWGDLDHAGILEAASAWSVSRSRGESGEDPIRLELAAGGTTEVPGSIFLDLVHLFAANSLEYRIRKGLSLERLEPLRPLLCPEARAWLDGPRSDPLPTLLGYDDLAIEVRLARPGDREWILDFLTPAFSVPSHMAPDAVVELRVDREHFQRLEARGPAASRALVDGFNLNDAVSRFERWADASGREAASGGDRTPVEQTLFDPVFGVFYELGPGLSVRITARSGVRCRMSLMRIVRELAMHASLRQGGVVVHAASLCIDGFAIVIAGDKSAGKTTSLTWGLQLLERAAFLSNDRVRLRPTATGFEVRGIPTVMAFRPQSLELLPEFGSMLRAQRGIYHLSPSELEERGDLPLVEPWSDGRLGFAPSRYARLLGRRSEGSAAAGAVVFPEVVADEGGLRAEPLAPAEARARLDRATFWVADEARPRLFDVPSAAPFPSRAELGERVRRIVETVPCFVWKVGRGAPRDREGLERFVAEMARRSESHPAEGAGRRRERPKPERA